MTIKPPLQVDHELQLYDIDELMEWIERFAPFGPEIAVRLRYQGCLRL